MKAPEYYGRPRREMLTFVPEATRSLLDVGCGAGAFAAALREQRGEELHIEGIEMDPAAAKRAAEVLHTVHRGDAGDRLPELGAGRFDCITMNDVLEHVLEPEDLLRAARPLLKDGGRLVASIPNVRYFFNVVDLAVKGSWEYTDEGILDRTHFRFFTRSSICRMLPQCGFEIEHVVGINPTASLKFRLVDLLTLGRWRDMKYLQFAVVARPAALKR